MSYDKLHIQPSNIDALANANRDILEPAFGASFLEKSVDDLLSLDEVTDANEVLADMVYGQDIASMVRRGKYKEIVALRNEIADEISTPESAISGLDLDKVGVVVVRPEILSNSEDCVRLLEQSGCTTLLTKDLEPTLEQYISLYPHGLAIPETYYDFPTRTLNYVAKASKLLVVTSGTDNSVATSTLLSEQFKGTQGTFTSGTLRGHVALRSLRVYIQGRASFTPQGALALDPIGAYRKLVLGAISSNEIHNTVDAPLLFYAGQGVHVPDRDEIERDLRILCSAEDIEQIKRGLAGRE